MTIRVEYFMSWKAFVALTSALASTITQCVSQLVTATDISTTRLTAALSLLHMALCNRVAADTRIDTSTLVDVYLTIHLLYANGEVGHRESLRVEGVKVWSAWAAKVGEEQVVEVIHHVRSRIGLMISDVDTAFE